MTAGDERRHPDGPPDGRSPAQRDRDRILYTSALRRLAETTQVMPARAGHVYHNRLTHTLEVAQLARRIAERAGREDPDVPAPDPDACEAAAWAHDLGHPPYGHTGEAALDAALRSRWPEGDGYEGNAQTFRIVTRLAVRSSLHPGLNLTRRTLAATLKYPWLRGGRPGHKFGAYRTEEADFHWAVQGNEEPSVEAQVVDAADDVAYSVHDLFDFTRAGLIPLHLLRHSDQEAESLLAATAAANPDIPQEAIERARRNHLARYPLDAPFDGSMAHRAALRSYTSSLIAALVRRGMRLGSSGLVRDEEASAALALFQQATVHYVLEDPAIAPAKARQRQVIETLVAWYADGSRLPVAAREQLEEGQPIDRAVADAVASLTEAEADQAALEAGGILPSP
jgi:dGTPase